MNNIEKQEKIKPKLELPSNEFKNSYNEGIKEFQEEGKRDYLNINELEENFDLLIKKLEDEAKGINLKKDRFPQTELWLVENRKYIGDIRIRHGLNKQLKKIGGHIGYGIRPAERKKGYGKLILKLGLEKAKEIGLKEVLITCDKSNIGSKKIIETSGGELIDCKIINEQEEPVCSYKIIIE